MYSLSTAEIHMPTILKAIALLAQVARPIQYQNNLDSDRFWTLTTINFIL